MISHELKQLIFINAASLPFAKVDIDGNTLFAGRNGAGKTTILRAVLYFYGAFRSEALGINRKKMRFEEYYFASSNAYLVYTFTNAYGTVLAIVYKSGGMRLRYRFAKVPLDFDLSGIETLFIKEHKAHEPKELFHTLLTQNFELSPVLNSPKEYKAVLYGQDRSLITYSFYPANASYDQIAKTISNIFVNSKLDSGSIKRSLALSVSGFEPIDLAQIEQKIDAFRVQHEDIKAFEKNLPHINEALDRLNTLEVQKETISQKMMQLRTNAQAFTQTSQHIDAELETLSIDQARLHEEIKVSQEAYDVQIKSLGEEAAILQHDLASADKKYQEYQVQDIASKLLRYEQRAQMQERLKSLYHQKQLFTQEFHSATARFDALSKELTATHEKALHALELKKHTLQETHHQETQTLLVSHEKALEALQEDTLQETLEHAVQEASRLLTQSEQALLHLQEKRFLADEMQVAQHTAATAKEAYAARDQKQRLDKKELEILYGKKSALEAQFHSKSEHVRARYMHAKEKLDSAIEALHLKLKQLQSSVAHAINRSQSTHKELLVNVLRDEVLFASDLSPSFQEGHSLLGLTLAWERIPKQTLSLETLNAQLQTLQAKLIEEKKAYDAQILTLETELKQQLKTLLTQESQLRNDVDAGHMALQQLERAALSAQEALLSLEGKQKEIKAQALQTHQTTLKSHQTAFVQAKETLNEHKAAQEAKRVTLKERFADQKNALTRTLTDALLELNHARESELKRYEEAASTIKQQTQEALLAQGVDPKLLADLELHIQTLEHDLEEIEALSRLVHQYYVDKERLFDTRQATNTALETLRHTIDETNRIFRAQSAQFDTQRESLKKRRKSLQQQKEQLDQDLQAFARFESTSDYAAFAAHVTEELAPNEERLDVLVFALQEHISLQKDTLRALHKKLQMVFNMLSEGSSFNLTRPQHDDDISMIMAAKALKGFIQENKLEAFKSEVAQLYRGTLHYIASETTELLKADQEIKKVVSHINTTLKDLQGIKVIENVELRFKESDNSLLYALKEIVQLSTYISPFGSDTLFGQGEEKTHHKEMLKALDTLSKELHSDKRDFLSVDDSFVLEFRAVENGHDTGFVPSLDGIGSNGTDVMVKAMVYIAMLTLARKQSSKNDQGVYFHCILDEVGILAPNYLKELIEYANNKQIRFINGAPDEKLVTTYKRLYMLSTNTQHQTIVRRLLAQA